MEQNQIVQQVSDCFKTSKIQAQILETFQFFTKPCFDHHYHKPVRLMALQHKDFQLIEISKQKWADNMQFTDRRETFTCSLQMLCSFTSALSRPLILFFSGNLVKLPRYIKIPTPSCPNWFTISWKWNWKSQRHESHEGYKSKMICHNFQSFPQQQNYNHRQNG